MGAGVRIPSALLDSTQAVCVRGKREPGRLELFLGAEPSDPHGACSLRTSAGRLSLLLACFVSTGLILSSGPLSSDFWVLVLWTCGGALVWRNSGGQSPPDFVSTFAVELLSVVDGGLVEVVGGLVEQVSSRDQLSEPLSRSCSRSSRAGRPVLFCCAGRGGATWRPSCPRWCAGTGAPWCRFPCWSVSGRPGWRPV